MFVFSVKHVSVVWSDGMVLYGFKPFFLNIFIHNSPVYLRKKDNQMASRLRVCASWSG